MTGKVVSIVGGNYKVYSNKEIFNLYCRGNLKRNDNTLLVGDNVVFNEKENVIEKIESRKNSLIRPRCCNIDLLMITMSVVEPELSPELIYKFLTYANLNNVNAAVLLTKLDLLEDKTDVLRLKSDLENLGYKVFMISNKKPENIRELQSFLANKTTIIMGQTGVGKSSAINIIDPQFNRKVGSYSEALGRGKHQTKEVILLPFTNGFLGDTPGFSSLELNLYKEDLASYFPGYEKYYLNCYFSNCLHQNEKQCKIKEKINDSILSKEGYEIYLKLLGQLDHKSQRYKK